MAVKQASAYKVSAGALYGVAAADLALYLIGGQQCRVFLQQKAENGLLSACVFLLG